MSETTSSCPICKGVGYLRTDVPYGHPQFGKPIACACKEAERAEKRRQHLYALSNLAALHEMSFATFNKRVPGVLEAFRAAWAFAQRPVGWLLLVGPNGCGKTHLAAAVANACLLQEKSVLFVITPDLLDHLRATFAPTSTVAYDELFWRIREAEVLVIDDLGTEQPSPWAAEKLFQLFNHRYTGRLPTVITANKAGLQAVDARISSRLADASLVRTVILDEATDYRPHRTTPKVVDTEQVSNPRYETKRSIQHDDRQTRRSRATIPVRHETIRF
jgi:DNA replication protein DnaC